MDDINREVRRAMLKPLARRSQRIADREAALMSALNRLDDRALGEAVLGQLRDVLAALTDKRTEFRKDPLRAAKLVKLAKALYASRRVSTQEYVLFAVSPVERVHEERWMRGDYQNELGPISEAMKSIEEEHGLEPDQYWPLGESPEEYSRLNVQYDAVLDERFMTTLREFGLDDLSELKEQNPAEFNQLLERGRRAIFHRSEYILAIRDVVVRYEEDARRAASVKAYSAAVTSLGAGVEGLLLIRCLRSRHKAHRIASNLKRRVRPRHPEDPTTWTFEALIETCQKAGWLPPVETSVAQYDAAGLAHLLRVMRNHVHPGRQARQRPWSETDEREYQDAEAIYVILLSTLGKIGRSKQAPAPQPSQG
jgi:hypothetical protein